MNLIDAKRELQQLENEEIYWLNEKELAESITNVKSIQILPDKVSGGIYDDKMLKHMIVLDEKKILETLEYINRRKRNVMNYIEQELKIIGEYSNLEKRIYELRYDKEYIRLNNKRRSFRQIGELVGYSDMQCIRILQKMLSRRNV